MKTKIRARVVEDQQAREILETYYNSRIVSYLVLHDKFGFGEKRIKKLEETVNKYFDDYDDGMYQVGFFETEMKKRGIDVKSVVHEIPTRIRMMLTYGSRIPKRITPQDATTIRCSMQTFYAVTLYALNKDMKVSIKRLQEIYLKWMQFNFECMGEKNRLKIDDIVTVLCEECNYLDPRYAKEAAV